MRGKARGTSGERQGEGRAPWESSFTEFSLTRASFPPHPAKSSYPPPQEPFALAVARRDLVRLMGRLERASECTGLKKEGGDAAAWAERLATVRDVPSLLQVRLCGEGGEEG